MKKLVLNFIMLSLFTSSSAQTEGILNYKLTTNVGFGLYETNKVIYFKDRRSMEYFVPKKVSESTEKVSETEYKEVSIIKSNKRAFIFKDIGKRKLILSDNIISKVFLISDTLNNFKWKVTSEHQKILNFNCTKALVNFRGRTYTAWFSDKIPLPLGPWKFGGLPGLIIRVSDNENKFVYEITGIDLKTRFGDNLLEIRSEYKNDKILSHKEFFLLFGNKVKDLEKLSRTYDGNNKLGISNFKIAIPEKQEKF
ncbi:GLPGLI family protein [Pedobacter aquatilis]|uniref:GLPGLI family protein n=1 Tax=Pedobacter aquatilis TaxID=351343 RepID=UPI00292CFB2D|nr:GLPGLI family protein [Pedobacter aquatilis]